MNTLNELLLETPANGAVSSASIRRGAVVGSGTSSTFSVRDEQIHALVQQLFLRPEAGLVRNVVFAPIAESMQMGPLCLDIASTLAEEHKYDIGLIDAGFDNNPLQQQLEIPAPSIPKVSWQVSRRLEMVPRQSWWPESGVEPVTDDNLKRLREIMTDFDFSILCGAPVCWITARIGHACDGLVLVLSANRTRRLVASRILDRLRKTGVAVLGTVLADRRFPIPEGLYRSL